MTIRVISTMPLNAETVKKVEAVFIKKHIEKIDFAYETDSTLIGGLMVIDGENYYDATIKGQLSIIKKILI